MWAAGPLQLWTTGGNGTRHRLLFLQVALWSVPIPPLEIEIAA